MNCLWCGCRIQYEEKVCTRCGAPNRTEKVAHTEIRAGIGNQLIYSSYLDKKKITLTSQLLRTDNMGHCCGLFYCPEENLTLIDQESGSTRTYTKDQTKLFDGKHGLGLKLNHLYEACILILNKNLVL